MRRAHKDPDSKIITDKLKYIEDNSTNNKKITDILLAEQKGFCAYTDEYLSRTDARDIEHFNPTIKNTLQDNYNNWFLVKHQWNKEKASKWIKFQPILHPAAADFEDRIVYDNGDYIANSDADIEAKNLISLLQLDDLALADKRKKYINRKRSEINNAQTEPHHFFSILINDDPSQVSYLRALKEEFKIDIWAILP